MRHQHNGMFHRPQKITRIARFRFGTYGMFSGWNPSSHHEVFYTDTHRGQWIKTMTSANGYVTVEISYGIETWRSGVVVSIEKGGVQWRFNMREIDHANDEYISIEA